MAKAIAASGHQLVSRTAISILQQGGNAFDAAISAGFVSSVVEPALTSLGGGGFMLARTAAGDTILFDFFSDTPGKGLPAQQLEPHFFPVTVKFAGSDQDFNVGLGSVAVPGTLHGFLHIHKQLGTLSLQQIVAPAIQAARGGVRLSEQQAHFLQLLEPILTMSAAGKKLFAPNGNYLDTDDLLVNKDLATFLEKLSCDSSHTFYQSTLAESIALDMRRGQGLLTADDLHGYNVYHRDPLIAQYRNRQLLTNPAPSFGGSLIAMALERLQPYPLPTMQPGSPQYMTTHAKVMLAVERDRHQVHANSSDFNTKAPSFHRGTTHLSVVDHHGNVASMTNSNGEGSGYIVPGTGIMLNNMMGEDDLHPDGFHSSPPGLRVASMMSPSLLLDTHDRVELVIGSGGSKRIRTAITQVISLIVDCQMDVQQAVNFPRFHFDGTTFQVEPGFSEAAITALRAVGPVNIWKKKNVYFGGVHAVVLDQGGGGDPRRGGSVTQWTPNKTE